MSDEVFDLRSHSLCETMIYTEGTISNEEAGRSVVATTLSVNVSLNETGVVMFIVSSSNRP